MNGKVLWMSKLTIWRKEGVRSDQLIQQLEDADIQAIVKEADVILMTIGGNDIMKVVKKNLFNLTEEPFYDELGI